MITRKIHNKYIDSQVRALKYITETNRYKGRDA